MTEELIRLSASPAISLPCGFDKHGRPVGLQLVGRHRGEAALLAAGAFYEMEKGLSSRVPIDPRAGEVPPVDRAPAPESAPANPQTP